MQRERSTGISTTGEECEGRPAAEPYVHKLIARTRAYLHSGGRLCALIGVPWRGVSFSTLSTGRVVLKQYVWTGVESAKQAETPWHTYEGTQTTA